MEIDAKKILIILQGSVGDVVRAIPLANLLREAYPKARIAWAIEAAAFPLIEGHPAIDQPIVFDRKRWWRTLPPFLRRIREEKFDLVLDLQRILKSGLVSWWSGAAVRVGFHRSEAKEGNWIFNNHRIAAAGQSVSKLEHYLKFADYLGVPTRPIRWQLSLAPAEERRVDQLLGGRSGRFAAYFVGSRWESKLWFPAETAACADEIERRYGLAAVLLGSAADAEFARRVAGAASGPTVNLVGETSLREAVGVLRRARVAVGPDTGLMHVAAAVGTPVVSLWGATSPERTGPYGFQDLVVRGKAPCAPCYLRRCPIGRACMRSIDIAEIVAKVGKALRLNPVNHGSMAL
ncbi:MAG TPA: lipopolysaccharide heptosyltransferase II [Candidatus Acidoferrales bacterium]|nr:lipopolysaccharide heptosyltransferase II [Candidatus Acidoferrales bacterium]